VQIMSDESGSENERCQMCIRHMTEWMTNLQIVTDGKCSPHWLWAHV